MPDGALTSTPSDGQPARHAGARTRCEGRATRGRVSDPHDVGREVRFLKVRGGMRPYRLLLLISLSLAAWPVFGQAPAPEAATPATAPSAAQPTPTPSPGSDAQALAETLNNPLADLVSVPFQFNWDQGVGVNRGTRFLLNIQPVVPFKLGEHVNLIGRVIIPLLGQPALVEGTSPAFGLSDLLASFFVSPDFPRWLVWGVGPVVSLPTSSEPTLGTGKFSLGPTALVLTQLGPVTVGVLWNHLWSVAGDGARPDVSQMFLQPFVAVTTRGAWTFSLQSEMAANWKATAGNQWTVPLTVGIAKLAGFGPFPASYQLGGGVYVVHPDLGPTWRLRAAVTILLPSKR